MVSDDRLVTATRSFLAQYFSGHTSLEVSRPRERQGLIEVKLVTPYAVLNESLVARGRTLEVALLALALETGRLLGAWSDQ